MFKNVLSFKGRITRREYTVSFLIIVIFITLLDSFIKNFDDYYLIKIIELPLYWILLAQGSKRSHDFGKSGWLQFIPLYPLMLIFTRGNYESNRFGTNPRLEKLEQISRNRTLNKENELFNAAFVDDTQRLVKCGYCSDTFDINTLVIDEGIISKKFICPNCSVRNLIVEK